MDWINLFWADFIIVTGAAMHEVAAAYSAWPAHPFPSMSLCPGNHSMWMMPVFSFVDFVDSVKGGVMPRLAFGYVDCLDRRLIVCEHVGVCTFVDLFFE